MDRVEVGGDLGALSQAEGPGLTLRPTGTSRRRIGQRRVEAFSGSKPGGKRPLARAKAMILRRIHMASADVRGVRG